MISLKALRTEKGLTMDQAAKKIGISKYTLYNYEHFKTQPSPAIIDKISEVYNVSYDAIRFHPTKEEIKKYKLENRYVSANTKRNSKLKKDTSKS